MTTQAELDPDWQLQARCRFEDPRIFFPLTDRQEAIAKQVCRQCVVREQCLDFALENEEKFGVWGGLSEDERRDILRGRRPR